MALTVGAAEAVLVDYVLNNIADDPGNITPLAREI
jgi:hypothetical protein